MADRPPPRWRALLKLPRPIYMRDIMVQNGDAQKSWIWASEIGWNAIPPNHPAFPAFGRASDEQVHACAGGI